MPGAIHPLLVHFPLALLLVGTGGLIWASFRSKSEGAAIQGFVNGTLGLGYAGLMLTIISGLYDLQASPKTLARDGWVTLTVIHLACGVLLMVVYGFVLYRRFFSSPVSLSAPELPPQMAAGGQAKDPVQVLNPSEIQTGLDRIGLALAIIGLLLLIATAWLGGQLVYEYRVGIG